MALAFAIRSEQQQQIHDESQPSLSYVHDSDRTENGYTYLTLVNVSPHGAAAITRATFTIRDPDTLVGIERKMPKPRGVVATKITTTDDVVFTEGEWMGSRYEFSLRMDDNIPPTAVNKVKLALVNKTWAGESFTGELSIDYNGDNSPLVLDNVTIQGRRQK